MTCNERRELIYLHAAGVLEDDERVALDAHLASGCRRCGDALEAAREELATLVLSLAPVVPPARVREHLLARAREQASRDPSPGNRRAPRIQRSHFPRRRFAANAFAVLAAAALGLGLGWWQLARPLAHERDALAADRSALEAAHGATAAELAELHAERGEQDRELGALESQLERAAEVSSLLGTRELDILELAASEPGADAWGRAFWDSDYRCYFRAQGLTPLAAERHYVLWMIGPGERVHAAGALEPDLRGDATLLTRLPRELSPIVRSFVTAEDAPHGERPTGTVLLLGEARPH